MWSVTKFIEALADRRDVKVKIVMERNKAARGHRGEPLYGLDERISFRGGASSARGQFASEDTLHGVVSNPIGRFG